MRLALQISSWITVIICAFLLIGAMFAGDGELFVGCVMFGVAPTLALFYCYGNPKK